MAKTFYLIAGANGSGKTTLAHELLREEKDLAFLNADEIAAKIGDDLGLRAGRIILENADKFLASKKPVAMESTISGKYHERVIEKFKSAGYEIILIYVFLDAVDLNIARIQKRVLLGGHRVPDADVRRRYVRSIKNFLPTAKLANSWKLYYNGDDNYELIARSESGVLEIQNEDKYKMFNKTAK